MLQLEEGSTTGKTGAMEALLNRSVMTGNTIKQELFSGFYGPINRGGLRNPLGAKARSTSEAAFEAAAGGSNIIEGRTDQGMAGDPNASGPGRIRVPGTTGIFNYWKGKRGGQYFSHADSQRFAEEQQRQMRMGGDKSQQVDWPANNADVRWPKNNKNSFGFDSYDPGVRDLMDKALRGSTGGKVTGELNADVTFNNVPDGVRTSVDGKGFKKLKMTSTRMQQGATSDLGGLSYGDNDYSQWVA
jgi:hypothetical protein